MLNFIMTINILNISSGNSSNKTTNSKNNTINKNNKIVNFTFTVEFSLKLFSLCNQLSCPPNSGAV